MASLKSKKLKNGDLSWTITYYVTREPKCLFLGSKYSKSMAEEIARNVDWIARSIETGEPIRRSVAEWIDEVGPDLRQRLERAELICPERQITLDAVYDQFYKANENRVKQKTLDGYDITFKKIAGFFGGDTSIKSIDHETAEKFVTFLRNEGLASATVAGYIKNTRAIFNYALKSELIDRNPFMGIRGGSFENKVREYYLPIADYCKLIAAAPTAQWRALIALCRIGGLRNPSETLRVTWRDVDWDRGRLLVHSPKTERLPGHDVRVIPLFPELREQLELLWDETPAGSPETILNGLQKNSLHDQLLRIVFEAGLTPWPRLFHNLRGSRSCELFSQFPAHVAGNWMGQSYQIAIKHYLHPTDADFANATANAPSRPLKASESKQKQESYLPESVIDK